MVDITLLTYGDILVTISSIFSLFSLPLGPVGLVNVAVEEGAGHAD